MERSVPRFLIAGRLTRDYVILPTGDTFIDVPGGSALYATVGLAIWEPSPRPGMLSRVGEDYPRLWLEKFDQRGLDTRGVTILPQAIDVRTFTSYSDWETPTHRDPISQFANLGIPFPKSLLGYEDRSKSLDSRTKLLPTSLRQGDFPTDYLGATVAHLCPADYLTHSVLPALLRQAQFTFITLDPSPGYMNPTFLGDVPSIITGLTAFLPSEEEIRSLFHGRSFDLWEMIEALAVYGCEYIILKRGVRGQMLYDSTNHSRWEIPPYPARIVNPIGAGDAFCGGFLAGYCRTYDPLMAVLHGNISASLVIEGNDPLYALDCMPGLPQLRLESLKDSVRKI